MGHHIWVGNIPYTTTEEEIREIMSTVAPVVSVRIRYDKETGQSKGFAFCEYENAESCAVAVKHLHGAIVGGRPIRLDFCSSEQSKSYFLESQRASEGTDTYESRPLISQALNRCRKVEALPTPHDLRVPLRVEIAQIVESLSAAQLFYLLGHVQKLVLAAPDQARLILRDLVLSENPSLCYALLHAQFICGMVDEPFTQPLDSFSIADQIRNDRCHEQLEDVKRFYERSSETLLKRAQAVQGSSLTTVVAPSVMQERYDQSYVLPQAPIPTEQLMVQQCPSRNVIDPLHEDAAISLKNGALSTGSVETQNLIDQILANPHILQQILTITPEQEASWAPQEREEIVAIRAALYNRGIHI